MTESIHDQIFRNLDSKETEELINIWTTNNRAEWTDEAFEIIEEILTERKQELPTQDEPSYELVETTEEEFPETPYANPENEPVFYKPLQVLKLERFINLSIKPIVAGTIIISIPYITSLKKIVFSIFLTNPQLNAVAWFITFVVVGISIFIQCFITVVGLKALSSVLTILMEMEFRSRGIKTE